MKVRLIAALLVSASFAGPAIAQSVGIGTSPQGTMGYSIGSTIAKIAADKVKVQARVQPNSGETALIPLVNTGELNFGVSIMQEAAHAVAGTAHFKGRQQKDLRLAAVLFPLRTALFVRKDSNIRTIADLKGKRVTYGFTAMSAVNDALDGLLANGGLTKADIRPVMVPNVARGADEFISGNADAFYFAAGAAKVSEADSMAGGLRMLPISLEPAAVEAMQKIFPFGYATTLNPRPGLAGVTEPTPAQSYDNVLMVGAAEREDLVYRTVKALAENKADLAATFPPFNDFDPARMYKHAPVNFHPGALKYYRERGLVK